MIRAKGGLLLLIAVFCISKAFSQTDFRQGYVITLAQDTVAGLVDFREGFKPFESCIFKDSKTQSITTYLPDEISGYGFDNDKFFLSIEIQEKNQPTKRGFVEILVNGVVSLYKYKDIFFVEKNAGGLQQLINERKVEIFEDSRVLRNTNQHVGTLNIMMFDCGEVRSKIQKIDLVEKDLTRLVEDYNRCLGAPAITYKASKPWFRVLVGAHGGMNISKLEFDDLVGTFAHLDGPFEVSNSPIVGVSLDFLTPRLSERFSFHGDILYLSSKYYKYTLFDGPSFTERNYVTIELSQLKFPIGVRYTFPIKKITPFFNIGVSNTIHLSSNSTWTQELEIGNVVETTEREALEIKGSQLGIWGGFGVLTSFNKKLNAFFEFKYEHTNGITKITVDPQADSNITNFQFTVGLRSK